ncbi:hypothetical protein [Sphingomonas sp. 3-13AW]|uniref:hypothetical protein n=1 Tax=Sphingomonas sp. 3-13AW TaxID=3050450 RepID=UPI003BB6C054
MGFADHYPLAAFEAGYRASILGGPEVATHQEAVFFPAVEAHLLQLRGEGRLGMASGLAGRDVWSATAWNEMIAVGTFSPWLTSFLTEMALHGSHYNAEHGSLLSPENREAAISPHKRVEAAWKDLCTLMDTGTTENRFRLETLEDGLTGERCQLAFDNWHAKLLRWNGSAFEQAQDADAIPLATVEIDCPSGELVLCDAITVCDGAFHDIVDLGDRRYTTASLNSAQGALNYTTAVAADYGFAEIATSNTSVSVHQRGDCLLVSEMFSHDCLEGTVAQAPDNRWVQRGGFTCDRWMTTIVDRQVAVALLTRSGVADAASSLDAWIGDEMDEVVTLSVTPGRYRVHFGPTFSERFDRFSAGVPEGPEPWLFMERVA